MPECVTCGGYVSPDFVRVFGDNDRIVRSCLACHGASPEPVESVESVESDDRTVAEVEVEATPAAAYDDEQTDDLIGATLDADWVDEEGTSTDVAAYEVTDDEVAAYETTEYEVAEPETASTNAGSDRSRFGFLRSVFSR